MSALALLIALLKPVSLHAQHAVNPTDLQQRKNIILQNTDVYYEPFAPPGTHDVREYLSNRGDVYHDPDGVGEPGWDYQPQVFDSASNDFTALKNWAPHAAPLGWQEAWQRLFHAGYKPDGSPSDIIVGSTVDSATASGPVTVSALEDVDFRATGTIKLENGFHVMPGAFFHAYQEPKWDTTVFADEFDDTAKFHNQWYVYRGTGTAYSMPQCEYDSNVALVSDPDAEDGHAADLRFRVHLDTCSCDSLDERVEGCTDTVVSKNGVTVVHRSLTSNGYIRSCPFPSNSASNPRDWVYAHTPFGKYEVRDKVPAFPHHTNNWGLGADLEWDAGETWGISMQERHVGWGHRLVLGPLHGYFKIRGTSRGDTVFISYDDTLMYGREPAGTPWTLIINDARYGVIPWSPFVRDTFIATDAQQFPSSLATSTDTFTFYFTRKNDIVSDSVRWQIYRASNGAWVFRAPHHVVSGDSVFFRKEYQPVSLQITDSLDALSRPYQRTHLCHWSSFLNEPDQGLLILDDTNLHPVGISLAAASNFEQYTYVLPDQYSNSAKSGFGYRNSPYNAGLAPSGEDSIAYMSQPYRYHTFSMEYLPHEVRFLYDSVVMRRLPDRLIPPSSPYYHWIEQFGRSGLNIIPAEFNGGDLVAHIDFDATYQINYFLSHITNPGFWDVTINGHTSHAAHHLVDYVKVFDVPSNTVIPDYQQ
jgi:hypothetical protein